VLIVKHSRKAVVQDVLTASNHVLTQNRNQKKSFTRPSVRKKIREEKFLKTFKMNIQAALYIMMGMLSENFSCNFFFYFFL